VWDCPFRKYLHPSICLYFVLLFSYFLIYCIFFSDFLAIWSDSSHLPLWNFIFRNLYSSICQLVTLVTEETAASVAFDGPSVPSENCYLFRFCLYLYIYILIIFSDFFHYFFIFYRILLVYAFGIACLGNLQPPCLSTSTETLFLWLGSIICEVCGRRNSRISGYWWAISAITELLLLLLLNHCANFLALHGNLIQIHPSKMPERSFVERFWGLPEWQEKTPKRQKKSISFLFGALPPMIEGWQTGEPFESEYFLIYGNFFGIFSKLFTYSS